MNKKILLKLIIIISKILGKVKYFIKKSADFELIV
jgi:hypothetical protein